MLPENDKRVTKVLELSKESLDAFCDDISTMFEVEMSCEQVESSIGTLKDVKRHFKKLAAVHTVQAQGALEGNFQLVFDQSGLFTLAGVIVMLPAKRIIEEAKRGNLSDAQNMSDAVGEVGNLLTGTWDRIFRDELDGHKHFRKISTFLGDPWADPSKIPGLSDSERFHIIRYEISLESYPSFTTAVLMPLDSQNAEAKPPALQAEPAEAIVDETPDAEDQVLEEELTSSAQDEGPVEAEEIASEETETTEPAVAEPVESVSEEPKLETVFTAAEGGRDAEPAADRAEEGGDVIETAAPEVVNVVTSPPVPVPAPMSVAAPRPRDVGFDAIMSLKAREIMSTQVVWVEAQASVNDVLTVMQEQDVGYVMVGKPGNLQGLISKSNVLGAMSPYLRPVFAKWRRPADDATLDIKAQWIMSRPVRTVRPEASLRVVIEQMRQFGGRCLPVVAADGSVQGTITVFDVLQVITPDLDTGLAGRTPQAPCLMV